MLKLVKIKRDFGDGVGETQYLFDEFGDIHAAVCIDAQGVKTPATDRDEAETWYNSDRGK